MLFQLKLVLVFKLNPIWIKNTFMDFKFPQVYHIPVTITKTKTD